MKCLIIKLSAFLLTIPTITFAGWQIAKSSTPPSEPFFQSNPHPVKMATATSYALTSSSPVAYKSYSPTQSATSTKTETIVKQANLSPKGENFTVVNKLPVCKTPSCTAQSQTPSKDFPAKEVYAISVSGSLKENIERIMDRYHWKVVWKAPYDYNFDGRITGTSLPNVMEKLLRPFPLQGVLYMSNRTMTVVPRNV